METNEITSRIIGAAINVHRELGPGLLESAYQACLACEMSERGLRFEREKALPIVYKGVSLDCGYRIDFVVEERVVVELKAVPKVEPVCAAQMISYLKLTGYSTGLLINFHVPTLIQGVERFMLGEAGTKLPGRDAHKAEDDGNAILQRLFPPSP